MMKRDFIVYVDGAARGNPGPAGIGALICDLWERPIQKISQFIGIATNNQAEYQALLRAIVEARNLGATSLKVFSDSELMVNQMLNIYKVKDDDLRNLHEQVLAAAKGIRLEFRHIHRTKNRETDQLANQAIDEELKKAKAPSPANEEKMKKRLDVRAIQAAVKRAMLLDQISGVLESGAPEALTGVEEKPEVRADEAVPHPPHPKTALEEPPSAEEEEALEQKEETQISAGGLLYKKEGQKIKVCVIGKKNRRVWALPKGRVNAGETPEEAAKREVEEETGHLAEVREKIDEIKYHFYWKDNNTFYHKTVSFYLMPLVKEGHSRRDLEAEDVQWLTLGEAYKKLTYLNEKEVVRKAQKLLKI